MSRSSVVRASSFEKTALSGHYPNSSPFCSYFVAYSLPLSVPGTPDLHIGCLDLSDEAARLRFSSPKSHLQGINTQRSPHVIINCPTHDLPGEQIDNKRNIEFYGVDDQDILAVLNDLLMMPVLLLETQSVLHTFIGAAKGNNFDFADLLIAHSVRGLHCESLLTFDKKTARSAGFELINYT